MNFNNLLLIIPHFNNPKGLEKSLASISSNEKLDVLVVDDGSSFSFEEDTIKKAYKGFGNVYFIYLQKNKGIERALNEALEFSQKKIYKYIARLDCGDTCIYERFKVQKEFLKKNTGISLVGSFVDFVDVNDKFLYTLKLPTKDKIIRKKMYLNAMHIHPTIMFRKSILNRVGLYPETYKAAEDYAFFFNVIKHHKVANINKVLVKCELNPNGISSALRKSQTKNRIKLIKENFYFGFYPIYGFFRAIILHYLPLTFINRIKFYLKG